MSQAMIVRELVKLNRNNRIRFKKIDSNLLMAMKKDSKLRNSVLLTYFPLLLSMASNRFIKFNRLIKERRPGIQISSFFRYDDMISAGYIGMVECLLGSYDPSKGTFSSLVGSWIVGRMNMYLTKMIQPIVVNHRANKVSTEFSKTRYMLEQRTKCHVDRDSVWGYIRQYEPRPKQRLKKKRGRGNGRTVKCELSLLASNAHTIYSMHPNEEDGKELSVIEIQMSLANQSYEREISQVEAKKIVEKCLVGLSAREKDIVMRRANDETLEDIGKHHNVTKERIRQIEEEAFKKMRKCL
ncbi:MAG: hypothetical protein COU81_03970 [Candidatus Portnoybacteria bacterium CG10_big_fil_rev_8_21_14_0_10_36_7]|uniref:RNA polymerase sigma-70 domain-containing protein n=1 Tax=Candidatus Portnoybacteria bacterium CG10_big_fil_rev_8_21_14_0_10_36_7 TaxID=1974812 RepID=A0A2M8KD50_9BACT|nr:MAG: hypothetical protein COU81_03970 [Candidatus Portnoybacteria bacterium CG10_big_fil_rev_8_21_14_0_10_36_7]